MNEVFLTEMSNMLINFNKIQLERKEHIKKYYKYRKIHGEILDSMINYILSGKYNIDDHFDNIREDIYREIPKLHLELDSSDCDEITILNELFMYKNHPKLTSITEIYLKNKKFRNKDKIKLLTSMNNSYVSLFKIIGTDFKNGFVTYEDVFTKKKYKVIDVAMSSTLKIDKKRTIYVYNRIINVENISFGTGIHCMMTSENKLLKEFIKTHKYNKFSDYSRCMLLYDLSKKTKDLKVNRNYIN